MSSLFHRRVIDFSIRIVKKLKNQARFHARKTLKFAEKQTLCEEKELICKHPV